MHAKTHSATKTITTTTTATSTPPGQNTAARSDLVALWEAYHQTHYTNGCWRLVPGQVRPGSIPDTHVLIWLTAANPGSRLMDDTSNHKANTRLRQAIEQQATKCIGASYDKTCALPVLQPAEAQSCAGDWPVEKGWFVLLPAQAWAQTVSWWERLAERFGQNAIVVARPHNPVTIQAVNQAFRNRLIASGLMQESSTSFPQVSH